MGIGKPIQDYERKTLDLINLDYEGLEWCELGNQRTWERKPAKEIYISLGVNHTSLDLNGEDGALRVDLDVPVPSELLNRFDVITNYGTLEHVNNQFQAFKNVHDMCKVGGIIIHVLPPVGNWPNHCRYYYSKKFFEQLAEACKYELVNLEIFDIFEYKSPKNLIAVTYKKIEPCTFISGQKFQELDIFDTGDAIRTGNYTKYSLRDILRSIKKEFTKK